MDFSHTLILAAWGVLGLVVLLGVMLKTPRLRLWLIRCEAVPRALREFAAASWSQGGVLKMAVYCSLLPLVERRLPRRLTVWLCRTIGAQQGVDFSESEWPVQNYPTIDAFFTRGLRPGVRPLNREPLAVVSPADAEIAAVGSLQRGTLVQAKGMPYALSDLVPVEEASWFSDGTYLVLYLRPRDCHRVFCPVDEAAVRSAIATPGGAWPVSPEVSAAVNGVLVQNRRLVHLLETPNGRVGLVMVGAYNVGRITTAYDASLPSPAKRKPFRRDYDSAPQLQRGDWLATFHLGSTVVLLFERDRFQPDAELVGQSVRYGQKIGRWMPRSSATSTSAPEHR